MVYTVPRMVECSITLLYYRIVSKQICSTYFFSNSASFLEVNYNKMSVFLTDRICMHERDKNKNEN